MIVDKLNILTFNDNELNEIFPHLCSIKPNTFSANKLELQQFFYNDIAHNVYLDTYNIYLEYRYYPDSNKRWNYDFSTQHHNYTIVRFSHETDFAKFLLQFSIIIDSVGLPDIKSKFLHYHKSEHYSIESIQVNGLYVTKEIYGDDIYASEY